MLGINGVSMVVTNVGILYRVLWSFFDCLETVSVGISTSILQVTPPDLIPVDVAGLLEILSIDCVKLLKAICGETTDAVKGNIAIQPSCFVGSDYGVDSTYDCKLLCLEEW